MPSAAVRASRRRARNPPPYSRQDSPAEFLDTAQRVWAQYTHIIAKDSFLSPQENENLIRYTLLTKPYFRTAIMQCIGDSPECKRLYRLFTHTQRFKALINDPSWEPQHVGERTTLIDVETHMEDIHKGIEQELFHMIGETDFFARLGRLGRELLPPPRRCTPAPRRVPTPFPRAQTPPPPPPFDQNEARELEFRTAAQQVAIEAHRVAEALGVDPNDLGVYDANGRIRQQLPAEVEDEEEYFEAPAIEIDPGFFDAEPQGSSA